MLCSGSGAHPAYRTPITTTTTTNLRKNPPMQSTDTDFDFNVSAAVFAAHAAAAPSLQPDVAAVRVDFDISAAVAFSTHGTGVAPSRPPPAVSVPPAPPVPGFAADGAEEEPEPASVLAAPQVTPGQTGCTDGCDAEAATCIICLGEGPTMTLNCCRQGAHVRCMHRWLAVQETCPHCRAAQDEPAREGAGADWSSAASTSDDWGMMDVHDDVHGDYGFGFDVHDDDNDDDDGGFGLNYAHHGMSLERLHNRQYVRFPEDEFRHAHAPRFARHYGAFGGAALPTGRHGYAPTAHRDHHYHATTAGYQPSAYWGMPPSVGGGRDADVPVRDTPAATPAPTRRRHDPYTWQH